MDEETKSTLAVKQNSFDETSVMETREFSNMKDDETDLRKRVFSAELVSENSIHCGLTEGHSNESGDKNFSSSVKVAGGAEHSEKKITENAGQLVESPTHDVWKVCPFSSLPKWMQDNDYLLGGHRPPLKSFRACFQSVFKIHTETVNIWTHLLGCLFFIGVSPYYLHNIVPYMEKVVLGTFFASVILCLGMSTTYHIVSCHSEYVRKLFRKFDHCGISMLIMGSFVPYIYYGFYCEYYPKVFYLSLVCVLGTIFIMLSLWDKFSVPQFRKLRAILFAGFGLSGVFPAVHFTIVKGFMQAVYYASFGWLCLMAFLYLLGAAFYALRTPERFHPGKFDIWFHSHQIFHVLVIAAATVHFHGISVMVAYRQTLGSCDLELPAN